MLIPVILSGGSGSRLWPLSRHAMPKQFLELLGEDTLFQRTVRRAAIAVGATAPIVVCNDDHRFLVAHQLQVLGIEGATIIVEPVARNTAPALALAALAALERSGDAAELLVLPSDHLIDDEHAFAAAVTAARALAREGHLVTFGVKPTRAETGYGYIEAGAPLAVGGHRVARFVEKPDAERAASYVADGRHWWNSGMFVFGARRLLDELQRYEPPAASAARAALASAQRDLDFLRADRTAFEQAPSISIDYAVMERTEHAAVVKLAADWSDIGSWTAIWERSRHDAAGNALGGDVLALDSRNCLLLAAERRMVAALGVDDLLVIDTADAVMVAPRSRAQEIKRLVETLQAEGRTEHLLHRRVERPWGSYDSVDAAEGFQVKRIVVNPGASLSLQMHHKRSEHWIVVRGTAAVECDEKRLTLVPGQSTYIPVGSKHRLSNPGAMPLHLIEVQVGAYLGEDDIVRFSDNYGRS
jgi:mannose-1-phosphate guanylyltransferase/mannose-6-phosphate isomerase